MSPRVIEFVKAFRPDHLDVDKSHSIRIIQLSFFYVSIYSAVDATVFTDILPNHLLFE